MEEMEEKIHVKKIKTLICRGFIVLICILLLMFGPLAYLVYANIQIEAKISKLQDDVNKKDLDHHNDIQQLLRMSQSINTSLQNIMMDTEIHMKTLTNKIEDLSTQMSTLEDGMSDKISSLVKKVEQNLTAFNINFVNTTQQLIQQNLESSLQISQSAHLVNQTVMQLARDSKDLTELLHSYKADSLRLIGNSEKLVYLSENISQATLMKPWYFEEQEQLVVDLVDNMYNVTDILSEHNKLLHDFQASEEWVNVVYHILHVIITICGIFIAISHVLYWIRKGNKRTKTYKNSASTTCTDKVEAKKFPETQM